MPASERDWLVLGATPLALLIAGLLATEHGASVVLAGAGFSEWALPRGLDLSILPATRPESWAMLAALVPETLALIERAGAAPGIVDAPAMLVGETAATREAFQHMRHVAIGFGHKVDRLADVEIGEGAAGYKFPAARRLERPKLLPLLAAWLDGAGVRRVSPGPEGLTLRRDGSARLDVDGETLVATRTVFADDAAILAQPASFEPNLLGRLPGRTVLTEPARTLPAPAMIYFDRGTTLCQRSDGSLVAQVTGPHDTGLARLGACLVAQGPLRRAAEAEFEALTSRDGAPLIANARGSRAALLAGFGPAAAFFAPALARHLAGRASAFESSYFAARGLGKAAGRGPVADFITPTLLEAS